MITTRFSVVDPSAIGPLEGGVAFYALDPANAERLWELSERALA
jgi:hypothetical protein